MFSDPSGLFLTNGFLAFFALVAVALVLVAVALPVYAWLSAAWRQASDQVKQANGGLRSAAEAGDLRPPTLHLSRASWLGIHSGRGGLELRMDGHGTIPLSVTAQARQAGWMAGIVTGDIAFDRRVRVEGNEAEALGTLGAAARDLLSSLIWGGGATLQRGGIELRVVPRREVEQRVRELQRLAYVLWKRPKGGARRLAQNARSDFVPEVRLRNLTVLQATYPDSAEAQELSRVALGSTEAEWRLAGAALLDDEGGPTLRQIAGSPESPARLRLAALVHYCCTAPVEDALTTLGELGSETGTWLETVRDAVPTPDLLDLMDGIARRLVRVRDVAREPVLLRLMEFAPLATQPAFAEALGRVGTRVAVAPLLVWVEQSGDEAVAHAARSAIARIQSRLGDAEAGRLSVAIADESAGGLTAADQEPVGGLSPSPSSPSAATPSTDAAPRSGRDPDSSP